MTPERARKIAQECADLWHGGAAGLNLKEAITQGILEALQETEGDLVATRAERDICRQELSAAQKTLNDHLLSEAAETMRADKATSELAAAQIIAATGHPSPCTLGPLCPYCEIERLRAELAAARADYEALANSEATSAQLLRQELAAARALNEAMIANLPGPYYMDPPDGGSVNPEEQMRRLAKDADRYRWIKKQSIKMATAKDDICASASIPMFRFYCYDADYTVSILFRKRPPSLNGYILVAPQGNELDAAIDAALDKQRSGE